MKLSLLLGTELYKLGLKAICLGLSVALMGWVSVSSVQAQTLPQLDDQIADLKGQYRAELENYRNLDKQATIANQQYQQLNTLVSLETAVASVKKTMISRVTVLDLYLRLLRLELIQATGVEVSTKQQLQTEVETAISDIEAHLTKVNAANDRETLNQVGFEFIELSPEIQSIAYELQTQLALSRLQSIYDKLQIVKEDVRTQVASNSPVLQLPAQERAFAETDRNLETVLELLSETQTKINDQKSFTSGSYRSLTSTLDKVYSGLSQSLNFLGELVGIATNDR